MGAVVFDEKAHTYTSEKGKRFISVTTLIKKYVPPFDSHYWSTYKAIQEVMRKKGEWNTYKDNCGGWENVVAHTRMDPKFPYRAEVMEVKRRLLEEWRVNGNDAARKGTAFHKAKESADRTGGVVRVDGKDHSVHTGDPLKAQGFEEREGIFPELLIWDEELEIAGTADWVMRSGEMVEIKDYKTSKKIDQEGFMDTPLLYPVSHLLNANFFIYSLQLSLYGYMLERKGYKVGRLTIEHIDRESHALLGTYGTQYYKKEIEDILAHYSETRKEKAA